MSEIHRALAVFGLEPGVSHDAIQRRYKRLIMVWHPDRFPTDDGKRDAEEELKKINNANDLLKRHFASGHLVTGCECQAPIASTQSFNQSKHKAGPGQQKKSEDPEAEARGRDAERRRKAAAEEANRKSPEQPAQQRRSTAQEQYQNAQRQQDELKWNKIRWQIAAGEAALFIAICIFANVGFGVKEWWHDFSYKWEQDHAPKPQSLPNTTNSEPSYTSEQARIYSVDSPNGVAEGTGVELLPNGVAKPIDNSHVPIPHYPARGIDAGTLANPDNSDYLNMIQNQPERTQIPAAGGSVLDRWSKLETLPAVHRFAEPINRLSLPEFKRRERR